MDDCACRCPDQAVISSMNSSWYKGQKYEVLAPRWRLIGRWTWVAYLENGKSFTGKTFRQAAAVARAERAIRKGLQGKPRRNPGR
jgi:hypothetical protein